MGALLDFLPAPRSAGRPETGAAQVFAFPVVVSDRRWLAREAHRIRAGVAGATYRSIADATRRRLLAAGVPATSAEAEVLSACQFVQDRVNLFHRLDATGLLSSGLPPTGPGRRA